MMRRPRVSIGIPVYNGANYLQEAIASILAQTWADFELIISDNASTDRTREICESYAKDDPRIKYVRNQTNLGAAYNYNRIVDLASGCYFKWAAHDDLIAPTFLARCVEVLDSEPEVILAYPRTMIIDAAGDPVRPNEERMHLRMASPGERFARFLLTEGGECNAVFGLIRTDVLRETCLIGRYRGSDQVLLAELALRGQVHEVAEPLFMRRDHALTSLRANTSTKDVVVWFDTSRRRAIHLPTWRFLAEYARTAHRMPLSAADRLLCYKAIARWTWWGRSDFTQELRQAAAELLHGLWPRRSPIDAR